MNNDFEIKIAIKKLYLTGNLSRDEMIEYLHISRYKFDRNLTPARWEYEWAKKNLGNFLYDLRMAEVLRNANRKTLNFLKKIAA